MHQANDSALKDQTTMVKIIYALYLASLVAGVTSIIGVILAHVYHGNAAEVQRSHFQYQYRTFWMGLLYGLVCLLLAVIGIGFLLMLALPVWLIVRCAKGLVAISNGQPVANPTTWLW